MVRAGPTDAIRAPTDTSRVVLQMNGNRGSDWEPFKGEWRQAVRAAAEDNAITFEAIEDSATPERRPGVLLAVRVVDYRYISPAARYGFGIMTGNAFVESQVSFVDLATGERLGDRYYSTSSSAWEGVFSAMTNKQVQVIAAQMIQDVRLAGGPRADAAPRGVMPGDVKPFDPPPKAPVPVATRDRFGAERLAKDRACNPEPQATLVAKGPGYESYAVACTNGDSLAIRCEYGNCRALR